MVSGLIDVKGEEFVRQILGDERAFPRIRLERNYNLRKSERFEELQKYLQGQNLEASPIDISDSELRGLNALGLCLPYVIGNNADLESAILVGANFERANLERANLWSANLTGANLDYANLLRANFEKADLRNVKNLETAYHLGTAHFFRTIVTKIEKDTIEQAFEKANLFDLRKS